MSSTRPADAPARTRAWSSARTTLTRQNLQPRQQRACSLRTGIILQATQRGVSLIVGGARRLAQAARRRAETIAARARNHGLCDCSASAASASASASAFASASASASLHCRHVHCRQRQPRRRWHTQDARHRFGVTRRVPRLLLLLPRQIVLVPLPAISALALSTLAVSEQPTPTSDALSVASDNVTRRPSADASVPVPARAVNEAWTVSAEKILAAIDPTCGDHKAHMENVLMTTAASAQSSVTGPDRLLRWWNTSANYWEGPRRHPLLTGTRPSALRGASVAPERMQGRTFSRCKGTGTSASRPGRRSRRCTGRQAGAQLSKNVTPRIATDAYCWFWKRTVCNRDDTCERTSPPTMSG